MNFSARLCTLAIEALAICHISTSALGSYEKRLPTPDGLQSDVKFWESIFTKFNPHHCVYHDSTELNAVFIVKKLPESRHARRRTVRTQTKEIKNALKKLGTGKRATTALERRIVSGTPSHLRRPSYWRRAVSSLRCQRGVDFSDSVDRSRRYIGMIKGIFRQYGVPEDLAYLPHLESGFARFARSKAGARGLWQLIRPVAQRLGLTIKRRVDQRTDPYKSTIAAAKLLRQLRQQHKKWPLALTAYNYGTNGMRRAINKYGYDYMKIRKRHKTRIFKFAAKNYYPSILAVRNIVEKRQAANVAKYKVRPGDNLTHIAANFDSSIRRIKTLNNLKNNVIYAGQILKIGTNRL